MADNSFRFVLIGAGNIAGKYVTAINNIPQASLVGVVSRTAEKANDFAQKNNIENSSDSLKALAQQTEFEAVIITTPSGLHCDGAIQAAALKKHVLCEKPLDITLEKIDKMIAACKDANVKLACTFQHRAAPHNIATYNAVTSGKLGKIYIANTYLKKFRSQQYYDSAPWRGTYALDGGGPFIQQAAHTIDLMVWMMGPATSVFARTATLAHDIEVEDTGHALVQYKNGAQGVIEASTIITPGYPNRIEIHGEKGSIITTDSEIIDWSVEGLEPPKMENVGNVSGIKDPMAIGTQGHEKLIIDFIDAVKNDRDPVVPPQSARLSVELILAIYESSRKVKPIYL